MSNEQPPSNEVLDVRPYGVDFQRHKSGPVFTSERLKVMRIVLPRGKTLAEHQAPGEITVQCLEGCVAFTAGGKTQELPAGRLLFLTAGQRHAVEAIEDASLLVTIVLPR